MHQSMLAAHDLLGPLTQALKARAAADDLEQAVYGFDALDELGLHPLIQQAYRDAGYGVHPEQRYPGEDHHRRRSQGRRCDLVLTPDNRTLGDARITGTLFASALNAVGPEQAYWLEVKSIAQFTTEGPFHRYSAELLAPVARDVQKLLSDRIIAHAGLLLILFTQDAKVAEEDLAIWRKRCLNKGYLVGLPVRAGFAITDRLGNAWCETALFRIRGN